MFHRLPEHYLNTQRSWNLNRFHINTKKLTKTKTLTIKNEHMQFNKQKTDKIVISKITLSVELHGYFTKRTFTLLRN